MYQEVVRSDDEIDDLLDKCYDGGTHYRGMTYEDGIRAAIEWLTGLTDDNPIEEDA